MIACRSPDPEPGLVISYAYLWRHEHNAGLEEGRKVRPTVIVLSAYMPKNGDTRVTVAAITHRTPQSDTIAIEIPPKVQRHLRLDGKRSWVILDEVNAFNWPGFDLRPITGSKTEFAYGFIPPSLYEQIKQTLLAAHSLGKAKVTKRD